MASPTHRDNVGCQTDADAGDGMARGYIPRSGDIGTTAGACDILEGREGRKPLARGGSGTVHSAGAEARGSLGARRDGPGDGNLGALR